MHDHDADPAQQGIAIIGMAVRLPGAADVEAYWRNLLDGVCAIRQSNDAELRAAGFSAAELADPRLVRAFGPLDGVAEFDARFFGYPPARAEGLDPQQRLLLEVAWHAMEHAGYAPGTIDGAVGTYISITQSSYRPKTDNDLADSFFALTSRDKDYAASRIAYKLDLTGPSMMIQSASSGSLAAVHAAVEGLLSGQCDMAIAGGASIALPQGAYRYAPGLMLSPTGTCRAFDAAADGAVPGNGVGIVVLKPLAQAMADGDTVYAVIRGTALNNDGAQKSDYLAPSVQGQARVIGEALAVADIDPATVGYIETHGTGTLIGDPIEIRALSRVFKRDDFGARRCALGSLKPNIGHLHVASGIAGLVKAALAVHHGVLPPSLNFASANPETEFDKTPFYVNTACAAWTSDGLRRAGVSAFGLGGTNVHIVLEQSPAMSPEARAAGPVPLLLSAKTPAALEKLASNLARHLRDTPDIDLTAVAWTLAAGRARFEHRLAVLCADRAEAIEALESHSPLDATATGPMVDLARDFLAGAAADPVAAFADLPRRRLALPLYPFEKVRHWSQAEEVVASSAAVKLAASPAPSTDHLLPWLQSFVGQILRQDPAELDPDATYEAFGIDSLLVNSITQGLQERFPALRATALFEHNTLRRLAAHLAESDPAQARSLAGPEVIESAAPAEPVDAIAIIGMAGRYPGAPDIAAFWRNLRAGHDAIGEVPADRWDWHDHVDPERKDRAYTRWGGFITDVDKFDPLFFGITPREAKLLDPQQRLFIEAAWAALEDAGYTRQGLKEAARIAGGDVGVFAGAMHSAYRLLGMDAVAAGQLVQANHWSIANRVSYLFDFTGPSLAVDTACSASLAAVHLACESLRRGECGAAIAGGVSLVLHPQQPLELSRAGMLSKGPHNSAFGEAGDGFVQGEGVGVVLLKPLARALADGDRLHAVIRGSAMNAGGKTSGYTVPNPRAQADVVESALRRAGLAADTIGYVECHGTGTSLGDPIEIAGLSDAFRRSGRVGGTCAIGSVKSNIGHLESAAGIAGLTKAVLQLQHAELVPSLHASPRNGKIDFAAGPFRVQETCAAWPTPVDGVRRAGVSSFGAGGANVHVVLEQAPDASAAVAGKGPWVVPLSARTAERLSVVAETLRAAVMAQPDLDVADIAYTLAIGREAMEARAALVVADRADLMRQLVHVTSVQAQAGIGREATDQALARRDLATLAKLWTEGAPVDWTQLFAGERRRRIVLPTYPFLRERHWLPDAPAMPRAASLLYAVPTLAAEARWRIAFEPGAAILADHRVAGQATLPGVATIALAAEAARALGRGEAFRIRDLTWLRPLVAAADGVAAELVVRESTDGLPFEIVRDGVCHVRGRIEPVEPCTVLPDAVPAGRQTTAEQLYERLAGSDLIYGPAFRTVEAVTVDGSQAAATARTTGAFAGWPLDPGVLDAALQVTAMLFDSGGSVLPFAVGAIDVLRAPPARCRLQARRLDDGREAGIVRFDVVIADSEGRPCVVFHELAGRVRAAPVAVPPCFAPAWQEQATAPARAAPQGPILLVAAADHPLRASLEAALPSARAAAPDVVPARTVFLCDDDATSVDRLFALVQRLGRAASVTPVNLAVIGHAPASAIPPWIAAAMGLARVAAREFPSWSVRCLLVSSAADIPAALADPGDPLGREIAWRDGRRLVRTLQPATVRPVRPAFKRDGVYLILGGAGGIGLELATHIVTRHGGRVALVGRTPPDAARQARIDALGNAAAFFAADACRADDMARVVADIRRQFGRIDGAIHSAIVMQDQALAGMSAERFHAALDVKTLGTINLVEALAGEPLDWLALFSSANSFAANAGQANYVAGCTFKDAYASVAAERLGCRVRVINWGFWGEVGRVADPVYRARLEKRGVRSIATAEGIAAIERVLGGDHDQLLVLKAEDRVLRELGVVDAAPATADPAAVALAEHAALDALTRQAVATWASAGLPGRDRIAPRHHRLYDALAEMLSRAPRPVPAAADMATEEAAFVAAHPEMAPHVRLLRTCIDAYDRVLRGEALATDVMFPGSSMALVEGIYRGDRLTAHCNGAVAQAVRDAVEAHRGGTARVLEIGAGTGGTSASVLAALEASGAAVEYTYTDVSRAFALHGERSFGARYPFVRFGVLDLGRDPEAQGYAAHAYDIVLAANVVHVTADLALSCSRLNRLVAPGGSLVLYEMTAVPDFATATFGLLDGWWAFTDPRLAHAPLLDAPGWSRLLDVAGFDGVELRGIGGQTPDRFRHTVIVGRAAAAPVQAAAPRAAVIAEPAAPTVAASQDDALVEAICGVVVETLQMRRDQLALDRNFADYGADSIISVDLIAALNARFDIKLKPTILFSHPTIKQLAANLAGRGVRVASPAVPSPTPMATPVAPPRASAPPTGAWADDIAIVGMSGRFPGAATVDAFWQNIENGVDSVGPVPRSRWDHAAVYDPRPGTPGKTQCPDGGFLDDVESFDPLFFNLSPNEATLMDPQQRLFLQEAWHALEDAGYAGPHPAHARCGVFVGTVAGDYDSLLQRCGHDGNAQVFTGNAASMLAARIAYRLDLRGPCLSIDTACSSSLVAVQLACESLLRGESDMALAGGVAVLSTPDFYVAASNAGMLSPTGRCRTLDITADGFVPGETAAAIVLKRRADAERDGDTILALIKGAGTNQDGASNGITAPNGEAQAELLQSVYRRFALSPASIGYVELHGTGTRLGDPIEMEALRSVFAAQGTGCAVGSVKANIGHALPAAGIAGVIKLVLALRHRTIPPMVNFKTLNDHIVLDDGVFALPQARRPWVAKGPLRGAVSSFGFSGTNVHVVLEEPPRIRRPAAAARDGHVAALSASTETALRQQIMRLAAWLEANDDASLADICGTLARGRSHFKHRAAFAVRDAADLRAALDDPSRGRSFDDAEVAKLYPDGSFARLSLPGYPFERRRCWPVAALQVVKPVAAKKANGSLALFDAVVRDLGAVR